ncbi:MULTISPECIES: tetratricopeptide repeat protein [unclassified Lysobacter]|uniref:tetratricopeptide repeat protein n=1 Tax=unclassified Lysobacter TaxID=2635362 RepID=UPI001C236161|nr:tetratricopeptide repeat protein [Lysobacter sp. MMG2]MBU8977062.1 tetratricopeptide repeat protein [Lysobacter sp. MMG2]
MFSRTLFATALLAVTGAASAQSLPRPAEFYFDADANTLKPVVAVRETGDVAAQKLAKAIERNPHAKAEVAQLAHLAMAAGRIDLGKQLYARALSAIDRSDSLWRAVVWNYGWDLYRTGDFEGAFAQWRALVESRSVTASWMPPTLALSLWSMGRKDEAVQWYAAAVRSEPQQWNTTAQFARLLPDWSDADRTLLSEVQAAWAANPPRWP